MLVEKLDQLFQHMSGGPGQPPSPTSILIAELKPDDYVAGRPRLKEQQLRLPEEYEARFQQLMEAGFAWLNMNYCGLLRGHALVTIEYPRAVARGKGPTSVNFSGPTRAVADAKWDALAYVILE